ncbi:MAG: xylulokinase, partial [Myxococcales bacterium]|nr:xylulokinase [Myxococcales bacterium]
MSSRVRAAVVGVDVGTSGVRALLVDDRGEIVAQQTRGDGFEIAAPRPGWAEQQPERWWQAACAAIGAVVAEAGTAFEVRAVGLTGQMHSSVFLDAQRRVLRPALLWCDGRTEAQCREIDERLGGRTVALCGNLAFAGFTAPKLLWLREHEPERYAALDALLLPKDFVRLRLADDSDDALCTDVSDASGTLLLDIGGRRWSAEVLEALEIDAALLPRALESSEWSAEVGAAAAERCGLEPGTPIV